MMIKMCNILKWVNLPLFILMWLSFLKFTKPPQVSPDNSWVQTLGYAFQHDWQAGLDYIFTYGPLAYFYLAPYGSDWKVTVWWMVFSALFASLFLIKGSQLPTLTERLLYWFLSIVILSYKSLDPLHYLAIITGTLLVIQPPRWLNSQLFLGLILLMLATLSLTKFTHFLLVIVCISGIFWHQWQIYSRHRALVILLVFFSLWLTTWMLAGQSCWNLPTFILNSLRLASGYNEAMSLGYGTLLTEIYLAIILLVLISIMVLWSGRSISGLIILSTLFLVWKAGFVRHDAHSRQFFTVALLIPFLIERPVQKLFIGLLLASFFAAFTGLFLSANHNGMNYTPSNFIFHWYDKLLRNVSSLSALQAPSLRKQPTYLLPQIQAVVKQAPLDVFPPFQVVAILNQFNYRPRPVFQGYAASANLLELNGHFYTSAQAPEFVLFKLQPIDGRWPLLEDSQVIRILLRDYQLRLIENTFLLLQRHPRRQVATVPRLSQQVTFNEIIDIRRFSEENLLLRMDIRKSGWGKLWAFFYKLPEIFLEAQTLTGELYSYRLIPNLARFDFIVNPLITNDQDWIAGLLGKKRLATFKIILKNPKYEQFFQPRIDIHLSHFDN